MLAAPVFERASDVWSFTIKGGKHAEAMALLKKIRDYHLSQGVACRILSPINGIRSRAYAEVEHESLDAMARFLKAFGESDVWTNDLSKEPWDELFDDANATRYQYWIVQ